MNEIDDEAVIPVLAHGMLASMTVVRLSLQVLGRGDINEAMRADVVETAVEQIQLLVDALSDLARGLPVEALVLLQAPRASGAASATVRPGSSATLVGAGAAST